MKKNIPYRSIKAGKVIHVKKYTLKKLLNVLVLIERKKRLIEQEEYENRYCTSTSISWEDAEKKLQNAGNILQDRTMNWKALEKRLQDNGVNLPECGGNDLWEWAESELKERGLLLRDGALNWKEVERKLREKALLMRDDS